MKTTDVRGQMIDSSVDAAFSRDMKVSMIYL